MKRLALILTAVITLAGCGVTTTDPNIAPAPTPNNGGDNTAEPAPTATTSSEPAEDGTHTVVYKVAGTATKGSVTYGTPSGQEQTNGVRLPWAKTLKVEAFDILVITAQNGGGGTITCSITVDGKVVKRGKSSGAYAVVTCTAPIGL